MSRQHTSVTLYLGECRNIAIRDCVVTFDADAQALWDALSNDGFAENLAESLIKRARDEGFEKAEAKNKRAITELEESLESERRLNDSLESRLRED